VVIGSRAVAGANVEVHQNVVRETMGKVFNRIVRTITGLPFADTQCGFKLMARADVAPIFERSRIDGFSYDVELLFVAVRRGLPVSEVPVTWRNAPGSKVGMLSDPLRMLRDVWRIRRWHAGGAYG
jgi:dolichyl-phosphate beta-glucosyltransferase